MKKIRVWPVMKFLWKVTTVSCMTLPARRSLRVLIEPLLFVNLRQLLKSEYSYLKLKFVELNFNNIFELSFTDSDQLGIHFHNFAKNEVYRSIPESVKNGVPLFYLMPNCNTPVVTFTNEMHIAKFSQYWKPICMLDINMCQKSSLHSHQINILLKHDMPLPEFLYQPNSSGRHDNIQCNQAMSVLNVMLKEWSSFVLLENHSYIKLIEYVALAQHSSSCLMMFTFCLFLTVMPTFYPALFIWFALSPNHRASSCTWLSLVAPVVRCAIR